MRGNQKKNKEYQIQGSKVWNWTTNLTNWHSDTAVGSGWGPITIEHALEYAELLQKALQCKGLDLTCMQSKTVEEIFTNQDVLQVVMV